MCASVTLSNDSHKRLSLIGLFNCSGKCLLSCLVTAPLFPKDCREFVGLVFETVSHVPHPRLALALPPPLKWQGHSWVPLCPVYEVLGMTLMLCVWYPSTLPTGLHP